MGAFKRDDRLPQLGQPKKAKPLLGDDAEVKQADPLAILGARRRDDAAAGANAQVVEDAAQVEEQARLERLREAIRHMPAEQQAQAKKTCGCWG
jgi:hypothetical protein